ncbi:uncharacterized protein LOC125179170 [Hyalella azteca]|uniref:Uncharacterized protein LOC125179170 n=1 Tax=Hyalella azteca TaxID=294128 RepID=A0A979FWQ0_HYAAZ|nr:uncharacterized protein LOC125179170 [Hyalella azteca]
MPLDRTSPPSGVADEDDALPPVSGEFDPPSGRLAAVTRKANEINEFMNKGIKDKDELEYQYRTYLDRVQTLQEACEQQTNLNEEENQKRIKWWNYNNAGIVNVRVDVEKYLAEMTGARLKLRTSKPYSKGGQSSPNRRGQPRIQRRSKVSSREEFLRRLYFLASSDSEETAAKLLQEVKHLVSEGGFNLAEFVTNSDRLLSLVNNEKSFRRKIEINSSWLR